MPLTYDPAKSERNEARRGLLFSLAEHFDWTTALIAEDTRKDYGAERVNDFAAPGVMNLLRRAVVFSSWRSPMLAG